MANIVAGCFEQQADADGAIDKRLRQGFGRDRVAAFFVNPPGQRAQFAIGGDRAASPGAKAAAPPGAERGEPLTATRPQRIRK